jgi:hypothetical protein
MGFLPHRLKRSASFSHRRTVNLLAGKAGQSIHDICRCELPCRTSFALPRQVSRRRCVRSLWNGDLSSGHNLCKGIGFDTR